MISYGQIASRRQTYVASLPQFHNHGAAIRSPMTPERVVGMGAIETALGSTLNDSSQWSQVCAAVATLTDSDVVSLSSVAPIETNVSYMAGSATGAAVPDHGLAQRYASAKRSGFILETELSRPGVARSGVQPSSACGCLLDFGIDGTWLLRLQRFAPTQPFSRDELLRLGSIATLLQTTAWASGIGSKAAMDARLSFHGEMGLAFAVLSHSGSIVTCTAGFESALGHNLSVVNGFPLPRDHRDSRSLREAFVAVKSGASVKHVSISQDRVPCVATIRPLPESQSRISRLPLFGLTIHGLSERKAPCATLLASLFGLSAREADVASLLATGIAVNAIAERQGVSAGTIRVQLKSIFRKLGVRGQVELVARLNCSGL